VIVTDVEDNSIASAQGIEREDVITEVDGKPVTNVQSFREALNKADPKRGRASLSRPQRQQNFRGVESWRIAEV
jgi:S1-C subfamily serine protease